MTDTSAMLHRTPMRSFGEAARLEAESGRLAHEAAEMREFLKQGCKHPYDALKISAGAVESHMAHATERQLYIRCSLCDSFMQTTVAWHKD